MTIHRILATTFAAAALALSAPTAQAQVPGLLNYQGRVSVGTTAFQGSGQFKFALVSGDGTATYWSNDGSSTAGSQPTAAVTLNVAGGLYAVQLGDATLANMTAVPASVFSNADVRLRVWFDDGTNGFEQITPDQRITAVGYAMTAATVPDGSITGAKIAPGAIGSAQLGSNLSLSGTVTAGAFVGDGSGLTGMGSAGGLAWSTTTGTTQTANSNSGYLADNPAQILYTLPTTSAAGATVRITGSGAGGFKVVAGAGQLLQKGALGGTGLTAIWQSAALNASNFYPEGTPEMERIRVSADGSKIFMLNYQYALRSSDGGETWASTTQPSLPSQHSYQPYYVSATADLTKIYLPVHVYTGSGSTGARYYLTESTDLGQTWSTSTIVLPGGMDTDGSLYEMRVTSDGTGMWVFGYFGYNYSTNTNDYRLYSSSDSGATWTQRTFPPNGLNNPQAGNAFHVSKTDVTKFIFATYSNSDNQTHFYRTTDSGATWTDVGVPNPSPGGFAGPLIANDDLSKLALLKQQWTGNTYEFHSVVSTDTGATWTSTKLRENPPQNNYMNYFSASADFQRLAVSEQVYNNSTGYYTYSARLSTDGGATWQAMNGPTFASTSESTSAFRISPNGTKLLLQTGYNSGAFYRTTLNITGNYAVIAKQWASIEFQYLGNGNWAPITVTGNAYAE